MQEFGHPVSLPFFTFTIIKTKELKNKWLYVNNPCVNSSNSGVRTSVWLCRFLKSFLKFNLILFLQVTDATTAEQFKVSNIIFKDRVIYFY